jgi:major outer membrane protein
MKSVVVVLLTALGSRACALPVGNPGEASLFSIANCIEAPRCNFHDPCFDWSEVWNLRVGYYGDSVFNRHLETNRTSSTGRDIDKTEIFTNAGCIVLNLCDRIDAFAILGASNIAIKTDAIAWGLVGGFESELFFRTHFSWSAGGRATLVDCAGFLVGIEGQYFQTNPHCDRFIHYDTGTITHFENDRVRYSEWQAGVGIAYRFATGYPEVAMVPYVAVKWSGGCFKLNNFVFTEGTDTFTFTNLKTKKLWGYATGVSLTVCDSVGVSVEGRWGDEKAVYVNGQVCF